MIHWSICDADKKSVLAVARVALFRPSKKWLAPTFGLFGV